MGHGHARPVPLGTRPRDPVEGVTSRVRAAVAFCPPTDLLNYGAAGRSILDFRFDLSGSSFGVANLQARGPFAFRTFNPLTIGFTPVTDAAKVKELLAQVSPITHVSKDSAPALIFHGDADPNVPVQQSETFAAKMAAAGVPVKLVVRRGVGHDGVRRELVPEVADWLDGQFQPAAGR